MNGEKEFICRTYGNISGYRKNGSIPYKANGEKSLPWRKPEAYQAVSTLKSPQDFAFLPGVNSHLGWDAAKCYEASKLFIENLQYLEQHHLI